MIVRGCFDRTQGLNKWFLHLTRALSRAICSKSIALNINRSFSTTQATDDWPFIDLLHTLEARVGKLDKISAQPHTSLIILHSQHKRLTSDRFRTATYLTCDYDSLLAPTILFYHQGFIFLAQMVPYTKTIAKRIHHLFRASPYSWQKMTRIPIWAALSHVAWLGTSAFTVFSGIYGIYWRLKLKERLCIK